MSHQPKFANPFRPGAGHLPPYLAGRQEEVRDFVKLLGQDVILQNAILTGLRGVGKTVLLETFKPVAMREGWMWAGTDLSESMSISEENIAVRLLTDLSVLTSAINLYEDESEESTTALNFGYLRLQFENIPGLIADKLKGVLELVWRHIGKLGAHGVIFAYDEAQNLADHAARDQFPLSLILDVFQSLQRKGLRYMLVLTGLPTLFPKLIESRTYSERMFHVMFLEPLSEAETHDAIRKPIQETSCPVQFTDPSVAAVWNVTRGYPYFVQYVCREIFDVWVQALDAGRAMPTVPLNSIMRKLDTDFFAGRWSRATDRQRELLAIIAMLPNGDSEFSVAEIVESIANQRADKPFSSSHVSQMLVALSEAGLIYKNRHGKYSFAVPLLGDFIKRQSALMESWGG